jgi:hypothetical protein
MRVRNVECVLIFAYYLADILTPYPVSPLPSKPTISEVLVQGKHVDAVSQLLLSQGVPKNWIKALDETGKKKKK